MFKRNNLKRFVSIFMTALMLLASVPSFADGATTSSDTVLIFQQTFDMLPDSYYSEPSSGKSFAYLKTSSWTYAEANIQNAAIYIQNPSSQSTVADGSREWGGVGSDLMYGKTLVLNKQEKAAGKVAYDAQLTPDSTKNMILKTAVKRSGSTTAADMSIYMNGKADTAATSYSSTNGISLINFDNDGYIYVNKDAIAGTYTKLGKWKNDTWYEVTYEHSLATKFAVITIDGGEYDNASFYCTTMSQVGLNRLQYGFANASTTAACEFHIGYVEVWEGTSKTISDFNMMDSKLSFDSYSPNDSLGTSSFALRSSAYTGEKWNNAIDFYMERFDTPNMKFAVVDEEHGTSLAGNPVTTVGTNTRSRVTYKFAEPASKPVTNGVLVTEYSVNMDENMGAYFSHTYSAKMTNPGSASIFMEYYEGETYGNVKIDSGKWYTVMGITDFDAGTVDLYIYDDENPAKFNKSKHGYWTPPNDTMSLSTLNFEALSDGASASSYTYMDDFRVYNKNELEYISSYPANNVTLATVDDAVSLTYNAPVTSATVEVKKGATVVEPSAYNVIYAAKSIIIEPVDGFDLESNYTVTVSNVTDVFGNTLAESQTLSYSTPAKTYNLDYEIYSATYNADSDTYTYEEITAADITDGMTIRIGATITGNTAFTPLYAVCVYDESTNELLALNYFSKAEAVTEYTVSHERGLLLECKANTYVKVFAWDKAANTPLVDSIRIDY